ncbi:MAG: hypothetical protein PHU44_01395 [Syntrophales bacterium]|nr:hypothetical protein [Syntrophales bacterium]MDD5642103.1 hypothetical protein [Syntrophales bacterium]
MKKLLVVFIIIVLLVAPALADVKTIALNNKKLLEIESLLKSKGYNVKVLKGTKALVKHKDITSQLILLIYNYDTQKNGVYFLNYKDDNLITILKEER